uniref:Uncharacterized protein n=1 Tax=Rhizophora mucronata TaxID=61149 RepID=A0A2P2PKY9_RHIMU
MCQNKWYFSLSISKFVTRIFFCVLVCAHKSGVF